MGDGRAFAKVDANIDVIKAYADSAIESAKDAIGQLGSLGWGYLTGVSTVFLPALTAYPLVQPTAPGPLSVGSPPPVTTVTIPTAPAAPNITIPDAPAVTWPTIPSGSPALSGATYTPPVIGAYYDIPFPDSPIIDYGTLEIDMPTPIVIDPVDWSFVIGEIFDKNDPLIMAIKNRLINNVLYGGTGLTPAIEEAIWNRDLERNEQQIEDSTDKVIQMWAKKGFSLPDGMLAHSLSEVQKEYFNRMIDRSREISIKQAELEQANIFKSMELGTSLMIQYIGVLIKWEELILRAQEDTAKYFNEYIELQIKAHQDMIEVAKISAQIYEIRIKAELGKIEVYKAQMQAAMVIAGINEQIAKIYMAEITAAIAQYKGELEGDTLLVQIFSESVRAALAQAQVEEAKINGYAALIKGLVAKAEVYNSEVQGFLAQVQAEKVKIEASVAEIDAWGKGANALIAAHQVKIEEYKANQQWNIATASEFNSVSAQNMRASIDISRILSANAQVIANSMHQGFSIPLDAAKAVAQATTTLAAGAVSALHTSASMSYGESMQLEET